MSGGVLWCVTGERPGTSECIGQAKTGGQTEICEAGFDVMQESAFAAKKMGNACDVDPKTIRSTTIRSTAIRSTAIRSTAIGLVNIRASGIGIWRINIDIWSPAGGPMGEAQEGVMVLFRLRWSGDESRGDGAGIG